MKTSVALCTYNGEKFLSQQLESIFQQTHSVDELIVCDDGSTDNTLAILEAFCNAHSTILSVFQNEQNLGGRKNFEKCFNLCTGDVVFFCDQDDIWHPDKVKRTLSWFKEDNHSLGIATDAQLIDEGGRLLKNGFWESFAFSSGDAKRMALNDLGEFVITHHNIVAGAVLAIRKEAKPFVYPFHFPNNMWHDEWITIALSSVGRMKLMPEKLIDYRLHSGQQMGVGKGTSNLGEWARTIRHEEKLKADHTLYLSHSWETYTKAKRVREILPIPSLVELEKTLHIRLQDAKRKFLKQNPLLVRKARLVKWYKEDRFNTTMRDVFVM